MIINPYLVQPSGPSYGALTTAWIAATGETDLTILGALNTLETDLTTYGLTSKMKALYPFVGGTAAKHKYNFMNTAQYELTFFGGLTHSSNGVLPNGTNGYAKTGLVPSTAVFTNNQNMHQSYYSRTNVTETAYDMGAGATGVGNDFHLLCKYSDGNQYALYGTTALSANADSRGHYIALSAPSGVKAIKNGVVKNTAAVSTTNLSLYTTQDIIIFGQNANGVPGFFCTKQSSFNSIGLALTDTEAANFYTAVQTFQTTLGRQVGTPIPFAMPLDTYSGASVAYSAARRLSTAYTGSLIRVRRSSDNAEQNIGYNAFNRLDETALTTFVGAGNGFVTTWYDQSGNGNNAVQSTAANQPQIVLSGAIVKQSGLGNSEPALSFDGTSDFMDFTSLVTTTNYTAFVAAKRLNSGLSGQWITQKAAGAGTRPYAAILYTGTGIAFMSTYNSSTQISASTSSTAYMLLTSRWGSTQSIYINNSALTTSSGTDSNSGTGFDVIGRRTTAEYSNVNNTEIILYPSDKLTDLTGISNNINTFYSIY